MEEENENKIPEVSEEKHASKFRENPWMVSSIVLGIVVLVFIATNFTGITGGAVGVTDAGKIFLSYLDSAGADVNSVEITDITSQSGLYKISFSYGGEQYPPYYVTKDGSLIGFLTETNFAEEASTGSSEVEKSDKPAAELFIWSYCPYGVTALKPFAEVASLLGDNADFKVYLYYAGHGDFEVEQNKIQACIQKYDNDKYWDYAETFVDEIYEKCSGDIACDLKESTALMKSLGIDSDEILDCVDSEGDDLLEADYNAAKDAGVSGSPTLVVNGVKASVSRTAEAYKTAICSAFNDAPEACGTELSSAGTTASGNCG